MDKMLVAVALSGGVDSSVAAAILKDKGFRLIGISMIFDLPILGLINMPSARLNVVDDARRVCDRLGIRHYTLNVSEILYKKVIKDFLDEYIKGRTPNPCVRCNHFIKFGFLLRKASSLGAQYLATGHYARIVLDSDSPGLKRYRLVKARDESKDQSYFLYKLGQSQLKHIIFPLGDYTKTEVRLLAKKFGLPVADKLASQEICFLNNANYRDFIKQKFLKMGKEIKSGLILDTKGNILGRHKGIAFYTIGQREGLGISARQPLYVIHIDHIKNHIIVGTKDEVYKKELLVRSIHYIDRINRFKKTVALKVRIRYNHKEERAYVEPSDNGLRVRFIKPQFAITPGQSAVFYDGDTVIGGGIIDKVLK